MNLSLCLHVSLMLPFILISLKCFFISDTTMQTWIPLLYQLWMNSKGLCLNKRIEDKSFLDTKKELLLKTM